MTKRKAARIAARRTRETRSDNRIELLDGREKEFMLRSTFAIMEEPVGKRSSIMNNTDEAREDTTRKKTLAWQSCNQQSLC